MSAIRPKGTANIAAASKKAVGIQLRTMASAANSAPIEGSAMLTDEPMNGVKKLANVATTSAGARIEPSV